MKWDFSHASYIPKQTCLNTYLGCSRVARYKHLLEKADATVMKELDLVKFLQR